jgi:hypothetical protein
MTNSNSSPQIKPLTVRQIAIAVLCLVMAIAITGLLIYRHKQQHQWSSAKLLLRSKVIKRQVSSAPDAYESMTFTIPLTK